MDNFAKKIVGIIPARYASTRFPAKPLADIAGKKMIQRVYEQAQKASLLFDVLVATDDEGIFDFVLSFGGKVCMTSSKHTNGTERCAEAASLLGYTADAVINIQGDEPIIAPEQIDQVAEMLLAQSTDIATLQKAITYQDDLWNPTIIKVVSADEKAIYFSRNCMPHLRGIEKENYLKNHTFYKHIGLYGFQTSVLEKLVLLSPTPLENAEQLEQLRWIENGNAIKLATTSIESYSVDVPDDIAKIEKILAEKKNG